MSRINNPILFQARINCVRLFIAIDLPDAAKQQLAQIQRQLEGSLLRFVDPAILHLTLKFLGEVLPEKLPDLKNALAQIEYRSFRAQLKGLGAFPNLRNPRVIWVGFHSPAIYELHRLLEQKLIPLGFEPDRDFHPHVTLARAKGHESKLLRKLLELEEIDLGWVDVDEIKLKRSTLTSKGPIYEDLLVRKLE